MAVNIAFLTKFLFFGLAIGQYYVYKSALIKPFPAIIAAFLTNSNSRGNILTVALLNAGLGDFYFNSPDFWKTIVGIGFFSLCHLLIIASAPVNVVHAFYPSFKNPGSYLLGMSLSLSLLYPVFGLMTLAIVGYAIILSLLLITSFQHPPMFAGCVLFVISDVLVLAEMILTNTHPEYAGYLPGVSLPVYWTSLMVISLSTYC